MSSTATLHPLPLSAGLASAPPHQIPSALERACIAAKVAADIAKAEAEAQKKVADAKADFEKVSAESRRDVDVAQADADQAAAKAAPSSTDVTQAETDRRKKLNEAHYKYDLATYDANLLVAKAKCGGMVGDAKKSCEEAAQAKREADVAAAKARLDAVH